MGLTEYKKKRSFKGTPEPTGGKATKSKLVFVVQKHDASRLHYDFRLELNGVLVSWAVPKGPSLNPADKRLAMHVEDHPYDYRTFEGIIPEGNYGAGTVIVWDEGTYEPVEEASSKDTMEKILKRDHDKGSMKIRLHGTKLRGEFAIVKLKGKEDNSWLLIKHRDEFASTEDVTEQDASVVSGKTIEEMAEDPSKTWKSNRSAAKKSRTVSGRKTARKTITPVKKKEDAVNINEILENIDTKKKAKMPADMQPMLATLVDKPKNESGWLYEVKWDGFRSIAYLDRGSVELRSRNNKDFNKKFYPIHDALRHWKINVVVDGEIIVMNKDGKPDFNALQTWRSEADGLLVYYLFDILWLEGYDLMNVPLADRKNILRQVIPVHESIRVSEAFDTSATDFFALTDKLGLEGIVAKKKHSVYKPETRSRDWLKIKTERHQEVVIAGYTKNENSAKKFSALLLGVYEGKELVFIGPVGTGFTVKMQEDLLKKMKPLETKECPFEEIPDYNKPSRFRPDPPKASVKWLKPELVAEISYRSIGGEGGLRHPSFRGLREDKKAKDVHFENAEAAEALTAQNSKHALEEKVITPTGSIDRKTFLNPKDETQARSIEGHEIKFTNLSKVYWPDEGFTKRDMLNYYYQVAPIMLPYMKDRPQTLNRFPNGIKGHSFYQKDVTGKVPSWVETYKYFSEGDQREKHFMVCSNEASLLYMASLGCIEMHPWSSRTVKPDHPDWCVIDLDPDKKTTFDQVIEAALVTKEILNALELPSYCKTSGSTGLHIYIPLGAKYTYEESKEFARALVRIVHAQLPSFTTIERKVNDRNGKMYLDFLQNRPQATLAGPYSLRPKPGAPVSMPLDWSEVKKGLHINNFTMKNVPPRLKETGDLFSGVLGEGIEMEKAVKMMKSAFERV